MPGACALLRDVAVLIACNADDFLMAWARSHLKRSGTDAETVEI
jgi:hypothetical protein